MWNHHDSSEAANTLYATLDPEFHKYVERPRFHRGASKEVFEARLTAWRKKWAQ